MSVVGDVIPETIVLPVVGGKQRVFVRSGKSMVYREARYHPLQWPWYMK